MTKIPLEQITCEYIPANADTYYHFLWQIEDMQARRKFVKRIYDWFFPKLSNIDYVGMHKDVINHYFNQQKSFFKGIITNPE